MRAFYLIWIDLIVKARSLPANKSNWQFMTLFFMTIIMAVDFLVLMTVFEKFILGFNFYNFEIPMVPQDIGIPISVFILYVGPPLLVNYILIFRNRRYEILLQHYKAQNGKLAVTYIILGLLIPIILLWLGILYKLI